MARFLSNALLVAITVFAAATMWWVSGSGRVGTPVELSSKPRSPVELYQAPVAVGRVVPRLSELYQTFSGKVRPWETYSLSFEVGGRVIELGVNPDGSALDVGDRVVKGQILARLDDRVFRARESEANAKHEQAKSDLGRARKLKESEAGAISITEFQQRLTDLALAQAQLQMAKKNLEDTVLRSPTNGTIAYRRINAGESVLADRESFQLIEDDRMLLVVHVPESQVRELENRMREVRRFQRGGVVSPASLDDRLFRAHVQLEGRDRFGRPWPTIDGHVYQIAEVADDRTGLFEVEVQLDNRDRLLRAGMVATAKLVTNRLLNYRLPDSAVLFRRGAAYVFLVERQLVDVDAMFWTVGQTEAHRVRRVEVADWTEQGTDIIIPTDSASPWDVVLRGQRRLTDGQWVRVVDYQAGEATAAGDQRMTELTSRLPGGDSRTHESQQQSN